VGRVYAVVFGSLGLCTALIRDVIHGVDPQESLMRGWVVLLAFSGIGAIVGSIAERVLREAVEQRLRSELSEKLQQRSESKT
jgi:hypothetical protein